MIHVLPNKVLTKIFCMVTFIMYFHGTRRWIMIRKQRYLIFIRLLWTTVYPQVVICSAKRLIWEWIVVSKYIYVDGWIICKFYWFSHKKEKQIFQQELNVWFLECSLDVATHFVLPVATVLMSCNAQANWRAGSIQCWPAASHTALVLPALPDYVPVDMEEKGGRLGEGWDELQ